MILPIKKEKTVDDLLKECVDLQQHIKFKSLELEELKGKIDKMIPDDKYEIEGVAKFTRRAGGTRKLFDKNLVKNFVTPDEYEQCFKISETKPSISIMSWDNAELQKKMMEGKNDTTK
jgi:nucleoid-associated protein YejK